MNTIAIVPEGPQADQTYRAVAGRLQSSGKTPGEALDSLTAKLSPQDGGTLVFIQEFKPDRFFGEAQQRRLGELMDALRSAGDAGTTLCPDEQSELRRLIADELEATQHRAKALLDGLRS